MTVYSETCINRSCFKALTLLRRTDTFDPVSFLYASISRISKAETVKMTLLQTGNFFQSSDKKVTCLMGIQVLEFKRNRELILTFLSIFSKRNVFFLHFKKVILFFDFILQFLKESDTSEYNTAY